MPEKKTGPKEAQMRALREAKARGKPIAKPKVKALSRKVASIKGKARGGAV
jgi:hypothetical protein